MDGRREGGKHGREGGNTHVERIKWRNGREERRDCSCSKVKGQEGMKGKKRWNIYVQKIRAGMD